MMFQHFRLIGLALMLSLVAGSVGQAASFNCNEASTETEMAICADPELSALDDMMQMIWADYLTNLNEIHPIVDGQITDHPLRSPKIAKEEQRAWIRQNQACVGGLECLKESYRNRIRSISKSTFTGHGGNSSDYIRLYFQPMSGDCQKSSNLSVDQFYDKTKQLCYELIPNTRGFQFFTASGVMLIEYYELAPGYFDCYGLEILQMKLIGEGATTRHGWVTKYRYNEYYDQAEGKRQISNSSEVSLAINLKDGLEFDEYYFGCGMKNVDLSGGAGFGGKN